MKEKIIIYQTGKGTQFFKTQSFIEEINHDVFLKIDLKNIKTGNTDTEKIWQFPEKYVDSSIKPELPEKMKLTFSGGKTIKSIDNSFYNFFNQFKKWNETKKE